MMNWTISFMTETSPHKPLVAGSNPPAASSLLSHNDNYEMIVLILPEKRYRSCVR